MYKRRWRRGWKGLTDVVFYVYIIFLKKIKVNKKYKKIIFYFLFLKY